MNFSIIVPTLGTRIFELNRLLESLSIQECKDFEVIIVSQINHSEISELIKKWSNLRINHIKIENKGLSLARNIGIEKCVGDWILFSDDDCWYKENALNEIERIINTYKVDILTTQIYDPQLKQLYKNYSPKKKRIYSKLQLASKSSIEIAVKRKKIKNKFDELFGLGAKFNCCEEVDFLIQNFKNNKLMYYPIITVYHNKKNTKSSPEQIKAKGALYSKNFNIFISLLVCLRDLIIKKQNTFNLFFEGYFQYKSIKKDN